MTAKWETQVCLIPKPVLCLLCNSASSIVTFPGAAVASSVKWGITMGHRSYFHVLTIVDATVPGRVLGVKGTSLPIIPYMPRTKHHPGKNRNVLLTSKLSMPLGHFPTNWERFHLRRGWGGGSRGVGNSFKIVSGTLPFIPKLWTTWWGVHRDLLFIIQKCGPLTQSIFPISTLRKLYEPWTVPWQRVFYSFCRVHTQQHYKARGVYL